MEKTELERAGEELLRQTKEFGELVKRVKKLIKKTEGGE